MSTALAIGAVTAVLRGVLTNRLASVSGNLGGSTPDVSVLPPDIVLASNEVNVPDTLNLFLYRVMPNVGWRNIGYPARDSQGERVSCPPLALDLHYLLSAYSQVPFRAEVMLGYGMQVLHEAGVLPRELISARLSDLVNFPENILAASTLAEQIEMIKITPEGLSTEEISKLWSAFQTNYRPTVAYHVSVVLIESDRTARSALPVRESQVFVMPLNRPVINAVQPQLVNPSGTLTIQGYNLQADELRVRINGDTQIAPTADNISDTEISVELPNTLQTGVKTVQVVHYINYEPNDENPADLREGFESNTVSFILRPEIISISPDPVAQNQSLTLTVVTPVSERQQVQLFLGDQAISNFQLVGALPTTTLTFDIPADFTPGEYLVRLRIDGAESELQPATGPYSAPTVTVIP
ncbi:IPT/TIG domain-containing protein [Leptolyngbya sp. PCC 7375]|nr:IPT/TIG domain-containing protein [Leptolyngbya sp. PCC 7375]